MWPEVEAAARETKRELKLSGSDISKRIEQDDGLDVGIFDLNALNLLTISDTSLKSLPATIHNLKNLQTLLLYGNALDELPDSIQQLDKLKIFDVSRNRLTSIPATLAILTNLTTINCSGNQLATFPSLRHCAKLSVLDLSDNKLTEFPDICDDALANLSEVYLKGNEIPSIPGEIVRLSSLKHLSLASNKLTVLPKCLAEMSKLKDLHLELNPIADKRLLKLIQQCRTKQILDYVKQHGVNVTVSLAVKSSDTKVASKEGKSRKAQNEPKFQHKLHIVRHSDESVRLIYMDTVKDVRPFILCCVISSINLMGDRFKRFIQIQTKLHETVCGKREKSTIATHDLAKVCRTGNIVYYTADAPDAVEIQPLGKNRKVSAGHLYDMLKNEAEALRKEKKRNVYSGIHKYLYLLEKKEQFACLQDAERNVISLPPLTNGDLTKITPETTSIFIEVTSSTSATDCRQTMEALLQETLLGGFGASSTSNETTTTTTNGFIEQSLTVQQVKITDCDGNLRTVYPSKTDLQFDENSHILVERES